MQIELEDFQNGRPLILQSDELNQLLTKLRAGKKYEKIYDLAAKLDGREKYLVRANALYHMKDWKKLEQCCDKGLQISEESEFYNYKGRIAGKDSQFEDKVQHTSRAIELDPTIPAYHRNLGSAYYRLKAYEKAIACHIKAVELQPKNSINYHNQGAAFFRMGKFQSAKENFLIAIEKDKQLALSYSWLGDSERQLGNQERAKQLYQQAYDISGNVYFLKEKRSLVKKGDKSSGFFQKISKIFS